MIKIMTPGPTMVRENVRLARSIETTNPDLDMEFYDYYKETCEIISKLMNTKNVSYILSGEGILGLEAACASLTELGDKVLVLDNGIFGKGFGDFVSMYGGIPTLYSTDYREEINVEKLEEYLKENNDFKYATVVHCDTPSGMLNDISKICPILKKYGIITVVDSVSAMFGNEVDVDNSKIDILCGGSQKALSAPIGLTLLTVSDEAIKAMEDRKTPIPAFYANILMYKNYYVNKWFPYTMPISDIYGLRTALENVLNDKDIISRHEKIAKATRKTLTDAGLTLYNNSGYSNTVTVFRVPNGVKSEDILNTMIKEHNIMIAGSFDVFAGEVIRIGHMGEGANVIDVNETLHALELTLRKLGVELKQHLEI